MIVQGPDDKTIDFGDMPPDQVTAAMQKLYPAQPEMSLGDQAKDIGKSALYGLGQGEVGLYTAPLDIGAMAGGYLAKKAIGDSTLGITPESTAGQLLEKTFGTGEGKLGLPLEPPSATGMATKALGLDYTPETTAGKYTQTVANFVPGFMTAAKEKGIPFIQRSLDAAKQAAITGVASEGAGQLAEGTEYEPYARVAGALAPALFGKATSPQITDPTKQVALQTAEEMNIPVYRFQASKNPLTKMAASFEKDVPLSGAVGKTEKQIGAFNREVLKTIGQKGDAVTPEALNSADTQIGGTLNDMAKKYNFLATPDFVAKVKDIAKSASKNLVGVEAEAFNKQVNNLFDSIREGTGQLTGTAYQNLRSGIGRMLRSNDKFSPELAQLQDAIDAQMTSRMSVQDALKTNQARSQYRSMIALERVVKNAPNEPISPPKLQGAVNNVYKNYAYSGGDANNLEKLARLGNLLKDSYPNSGTTQRLAAFEGAKEAVKRFATGGSVAGAGIAAGASAGIPGILAGAAAPFALNRLALTPFLYQKMGTQPGFLEQMLSGTAPSLPYQFERGRQ